MNSSETSSNPGIDNEVVGMRSALVFVTARFFVFGLQSGQ